MPAELRTPYTYPLISWSSVIAGAAIAVAIGAMLALLGVAAGATAFNPFARGDDQGELISITGAIWITFSQLVAVQCGAYVAARAASYSDHHDGVLNGVIVWAIAFVFAVVAAAMGLSMGALSLFQGGGAQAATDLVNAARDTAAGLDTAAQAARADDIADATASIAWLAFATMAMGLVGGIAGGKLGGEHPKWSNRQRVLVVLPSPSDQRAI